MNKPVTPPLRRGRRVRILDGKRQRDGIVLRGGQGARVPVAVIGARGVAEAQWFPREALRQWSKPSKINPQLRAFLESKEGRAFAPGAAKRKTGTAKGKRRINPRLLSRNKPARGLPGLQGQRAHRTSGRAR